MISACCGANAYFEHDGGEGGIPFEEWTVCSKCGQPCSVVYEDAPSNREER